MQSPPSDVQVPTNVEEENRLSAVRRYDVLDTPPDQTFDRLCALAARICNTPIGLVSIVDADRIWFKARFGLDIDEIDRDPGLCASAILQDDPWIVEDARTDPRTLTNPLVASDFGLQFYLGIPLRTHDGHNLGTLCVLDFEPRAATASEVRNLTDLASVVVDELELRLASARAIALEAESRVQAESLNTLKSQLVGMVAHDVRNPLASIIMLADHLHTNVPEEPSENREFLDEIQGQAKHLLELVEGLLDLTKIESGAISLDVELIDVRAFLVDAVRFPARLAQSKGTTITLEEVPAGSVTADPKRLRQVVDNLISNAVKFSPPGSAIVVRGLLGDSSWQIEVEDQGPGISTSDREKLFAPFAKLSARPTGNESSSGLGLAICKRLVEAHGGEIGVCQSTGEGSVFWFSIPQQG